MNVQVAEVANLDSSHLARIKDSQSKDDCLQLICKLVVEELALQWQRALLVWEKLRLIGESEKTPGSKEFKKPKSHMITSPFPYYYNLEKNESEDFSRRECPSSLPPFLSRVLHR